MMSQESVQELSLARPPWNGVGKELEGLCRKAIFEFDLFQGAQKKLGIALSGGKDSLTLLFLLKAMLGRGLPDLELTAFHMSGSFSCGPAVQQNYLRKICEALEVELVICTSEVEVPLEELECYGCSRERRKQLFHAAKARGIEHLAFGHHRDDSIETLLMNLCQKAEFEPILPRVPMHRYGIVIIRPLFFASQELIRAFAKSYGFQRIVCQCPVGQRSMRAKTAQLLAEMELIFPQIRPNLLNAALTYGTRKALDIP
jgi:tRNA 2-thiocytidine biosynthesis protein TtcA